MSTPSSPQRPDMPATGAVRYRERLTPSVGTVLAASIGPIGLALVFLPLGTVAVVVAFVVGTVGVGSALWRQSAVIAITDTPEGTRLRAGQAHIDVGFLTGATMFVGEDAVAQRRTELDRRAFLVLRGWVPDVVKVDLNDPEDPTPYWLLSTRRPQRLARALNDAIRG